MKVLLRSTVAGFVLLVPAWLSAVEFETIPADDAREIGAWLVEQESTIKKPQVKIKADVDQANGVHIPDEMGIVVVPQKGLEESDTQLEKFQAKSGAPLAYLFTYHIAPIIDGKLAKVDDMRSVKFADESGNERTVYVHLLSVRQVDEDDYRLYLYGKGKKPLLDARFSEGEGPGSTPVAVEIKEVNEDTERGKVVVTVFGKYQASFKAGVLRNAPQR